MGTYIPVDPLTSSTVLESRVIKLEKKITDLEDHITMLNTELCTFKKYVKAKCRTI